MNLDSFLQHGGFDSDDGKIIADCINYNGENFSKIAGSLFGQFSQDIGSIIAEKFIERPIQDIERSDIRQYSDLVVQAVISMLEDKHADKFKKDFINSTIANQVGYRVYVYWILKKLEKAGLDIEDLKYSDVPQNFAQEIYNIFQSKSLTTLFIVLMSAGILEFSSNPVNDFEIEREIKILDINPKKLGKKLEELGAKKIFEGNIHDKYFDTAKLDLDRDKEKGKRSLRIRRKTTGKQEELFYTIKRKKKQNLSERKRDTNEEKQPRECYEKEFKINKFELFENILSDMGLRNSRNKEKPRVAYFIEIFIPEIGKNETVKFDFDSYEGIPPLLEIECESTEALEYFVEKLGLKDHVKLDTGSRGLYKHYDIKEKYNKNYLEDQGGIITWKS